MILLGGPSIPFGSRNLLLHWPCMYDNECYIRNHLVAPPIIFASYWALFGWGCVGDFYGLWRLCTSYRKGSASRSSGKILLLLVWGHVLCSWPRESLAALRRRQWPFLFAWVHTQGSSLMHRSKPQCLSFLLEETRSAHNIERALVFGKQPLVYPPSWRLHLSESRWWGVYRSWRSFIWTFGSNQRGLKIDEFL